VPNKPVNESFGPNTAPSERRVVPLEPQAERRRRQLVEIASELIADEGVEATSLPRVAEMAGIGRTAIYRYFARIEDLRSAVDADFDAHLIERISKEEISDGLLGLADATPDEVPPATRRLAEAVFDTLVERGPAGLVLRSYAPAHAAQDVVSEAAVRFAEPLLAIGLTPLQAELVGDASNAILTRLYYSARRGEITREVAGQISSSVLIGLVAALRNS
jgi:AcrR family transcriptional regulator